MIPIAQAGYVNLYGRDITDSRLAEEALRESETRYRALFAGAPGGILVADSRTMRFRYANPAVCRMLGYTGEELLRLSVADIHPRESLDHVMAEFRAQVEGEKVVSRELPALAPGVPPEQTVRAMRPFARQRELMVIGHQPNLGHLAALLLTGSTEGVTVDLKKGGCAALELSGLVTRGRATLRWLLPPRVLRRLG